MVDLSISSGSRGDVTVVHVGGEIDLYTAPQPGAALHEQITTGHTHLVVDLIGVSFMDSSGLRVLLQALRAARSRDGSLRLVCASERILKVLGITGLDKLFAISSSVAAACEAA